MKTVRMVSIRLTLCFALAFPAFAQSHDRFKGWCNSLQNASSSNLVQFLNAVVPDEKNARCATWAIYRLGLEHYEPAIPALVRLLDFRRPATEREKRGYTDIGGISGVWDLYPALGALDLIGKKALPEVLRVIEADSTSSVARENAVSIWMEIYRQSDEQPKGVALLKQEEIKTKGEAIKQRLKWAVAKALTWCNPREDAACQQAATTGSP